MVHMGYLGPVRLNAERFHRARVAAGLSVIEVARRAKMSDRTIFRHLNGQTAQARPEFVWRLLHVLPSPDMFEPVEIDDTKRKVSA